MDINVEKDPLFRLIHSMNKGEKKFFSLYCSRYETPQAKSYLQLFNTINGDSTYDNDRLKRSFRGSQLHVTKNYLYKLILEVLVHYNYKNKTLNSKLAEIEVLYEKKLFDLAEKLLFKARKLAEDKNDFIKVLETWKLEKQLLEAAGSPFNKKKLNAIQEQERHCMDMYKEIESYFQFRMEVKNWWNLHTNVEKEKDKKVFLKFAGYPLFQNTDSPRCTMSKYLLHDTRLTYYFTMGDYKSAFGENLLILKLLEAHPVFSENNLNMKGSHLANQISISTVLGKYESATQAMSELEMFYMHDFSAIPNRRIFVGHNAILSANIKMGKKQESFLLIDKMATKITNKKMTDVHVANDFYFNAACACVVFDEPGKSMHWINKILNSTDLEKNKSTSYYYMRIVELIALFELKDFDLLEYKLKSFVRFSIKRDSSNKLDKVLSDFIRKIIKDAKAYDKKGLLLMFVDLKKSIQKILSNSGKLQTSQYFDFVGWLESKIQNKPYAEIVAKGKELKAGKSNVQS